MTKEPLYLYDSNKSGRDHAPNYREIRPHKSCFNCEFYDFEFDWCANYYFWVYPSGEHICDDWIEG